MPPAAPPTGTVTFLFTDVEGSTRLLKQLRERYGEVLAKHRDLLRAAFDAADGYEVDSQGDSFFVAFRRAKDAVGAAVAAQRALAAELWAEQATLHVRMGIHTGEATLAGGRYVGLAVHRAARIAAAARGGQIVISQITHDLLHDEEEQLAGVEITDLGTRPLKDLERAVRLYEVSTDAIAADAEPEEIRIAILGPVEAARGGRALELGGRQQRALLGLLAVRGGAVVPVDAIVDALWPDDPPPSATKVVQTYVSRLRKALGDEAIERRGPGYALRVDRDSLDVLRFEELAERGRLEEALALWRGPALVDVADVPALRVEAERLEEVRVRALEERAAAAIEAGRHGEVVSELRALLAAQPLRERPRFLLMLALYRSGRQAEALDTYREARTLLVDELGIEPGEQLRGLEAAILRQEPELAASAPPTRGAVFVWRAGDGALEPLVALAEPLADGRELIVANLVPPGGDLAGAAAEVERVRAALTTRAVAARAVSFTSDDPGADAARLARDQDAQLALTPCPAELVAGGVVPPSVAAAFEQAPCDVALLAARNGETGGPVVVPFGAAEHDWAAVELAAWIALATHAPLRLLGSESGAGGRDASRTLATASLLLQRHLGLAATPTLAAPGPEGVVAAVADAGLVVAGLRETWPQEGVGAARLALLRDAAPPVLLVRRGRRPGGLAQPGAVTRYSWSRAR